ncbi:MAG: glycosyltransferase family 4 protein [Thermoflexales bacterium]
MRILFLTQVLPYPLDAGAKVRAYFVLRHLAQGHDVTLLSFTRPSDAPDAVAHLNTFCREVRTVPMRRTASDELLSMVKSVLSGAPHMIVRDEKADMLAASRAIARNTGFDVIHSDQLSMAYYALAAADASARRLRLVLDAHNAYFLIPQRMAAVTSNPVKRLYFRREAALFARYEADTYRRFDHVLTVSDEDLGHLRKLMSASKSASRQPQSPAFNPQASTPTFTSIPICVEPSQAPIPRDPKARGILILGGMHWPPNADGAEWFAREVFPRIRAQAPAARLFIVGARPPRALRVLGDFIGIRHPDQAGDAPIVVTGYVPDPSPFIEASTLMAVPLRSGGGMRVKIVEALNWGLPLVTTTVGGEGIDLTDGREALLADGAPGLAEAVLRVLGDAELAQRLADGGRTLVASRYDWRARYRVLDTVYAAWEEGMQARSG